MAALNYGWTSGMCTLLWLISRSSPCTPLAVARARNTAAGLQRLSLKMCSSNWGTQCCT